MRLVLRDADYIKLQYTSVDYPLVTEYFAPHYNNTYENPRYLWHECIVDSRVVALVCIDSQSDHILPNSFHISILEVDKNLRGDGMGTMIMKHLIDIAKDLPGIRVITCQLRDPELINFYSKFGFKMSSGYNGIKFARLYIR